MNKENQILNMKPHEPSNHSSGKYVRFLVMILTSTVIMHLLTFTNVSQLEHIYFSQVRVYMSIMMGSMMAIVMLLFMKEMYKNKMLNRLILIASSLLFVVSFGLIRNQTGIGDLAWMRGMIPHHSSAIMTSEKANLKDPEVKKLAEDIIQAQEEEIAHMRQLIDRLMKNP